MALQPAQDVTELPRNETLYFGGQQWGTVNSWNPVGANQNNAMATTANAQGSRTIMFETLYMYNFMDGSMKPLLAEGEPRLERCPDRSDREDQPRGEVVRRHAGHRKRRGEDLGNRHRHGQHRRGRLSGLHRRHRGRGRRYRRHQGQADGGRQAGQPAAPEGLPYGRLHRAKGLAGNA